MQVLAQFLWYFLFFGFVGWLAEVIYAACIQQKFVNRGFLSAPFCPIYGFGIVLVIFFLRPISDNVVMLFIGSVAICSLLELITGFLLEKSFHTRWWNYSESKFNFLGYLSLGFSLLWGISSTFVVRIVLPVLDTIILNIPSFFTLVTFIVVGSLLVIDFFVTVGAIAGINKQAKSLAHVYKQLREISEQLKDAPKQQQATLLEQQKELTQRHERLLTKVGPIKRRIFLAFPDMRNTRHSKEITELQYAMGKFAEDAKEFAEDMEQKRQKLVLETYEDRLPKSIERPFGYGLCFNKLFILFAIGNVVGCILETIWAFVTLHKFEMRVGLVYGPFIPVYGFGAVLITLCLYKFYKSRDLWLFLGSMVIGMSFEYFASYFQEKLLGTVSWDYTGTLLNFDGRTNLMYGLMWGILGLVWVKDLYPVISKAIEKIPKKVGNALTIALVIFFAYDAFISCAAVARQNERRDGIPPQNTFAQYLDEQFTDDYLEYIYPHMQDAKTGVENGERPE